MMVRMLGLRPMARMAALALLVVSVSAALARPLAPRVHALALGGAPDAVVLDARAGRAVVGRAGTGTISILDLTAARVLRTQRVGVPAPLAALAIALDPTTHHVFVADGGNGNAPGVVQVFDSRTGARLVTVRVGRQAGALAVDAVHERVVVANEADRTVSLLDARRGAVLRTTTVGLTPLAVAVDARTARAFVLGLATGALSLPPEAGATANLLAVLDTRSGAVLGRIPLGFGADAMAVDERRARLFVAGSAGTLSVRDAHDGALLRTVTLGGEPSALAVDGRRGRVFVGDALDGTLSVLDAANGALRRTVRIDATSPVPYPAPYALAVDADRDRIYLTTWGALVPLAGRGLILAGVGTLVVLDARTDAVQRRIAVGVAPQAIVADSGWVVVVNGGGEVVRHSAADWFAQGARRLGTWLPWLGRFTTPPSFVQAPGSVSLLEAGA